MNFLNDSLKTLKTVLAEGLDQSVYEGDTSEAGGANTRGVGQAENENLKKLCQHQSDEINVLRQQIYEYQQAKLSDISTTSKSLIETSAQSQQQNDSWFWEPETSSTSSKKDGTGSPSEEAEIDLTTIPLDTNDHEVMEKLRRQVSERDARLKSFGAENAELNEKLKISNGEIQQLNKNIELLDKQHQTAIEKVLQMKDDLQYKYNLILDRLNLQIEETDKLQKERKVVKEVEDSKNELLAQLDQQAKSHETLSTIAKNFELQMEDLSTANSQLETEIAELRAAVNDTPEVIVNNDDCLKKINSLVNANFKLSVTYENEDQFIETFAKWLTSTSAKIRDMDFEMSKLIDENKLIKEDTAKHVNERDALKSELVNYEIECTELVKNNSILMADIECLKGGGKLETILENDDEENIVVLERQLEDSNSLNQSLEDEFQSIQTKLEATESERSVYFDEIQQLKNQLTENVSKCKIYQEEIENLENEKSNYLFELNELKSEEERNILMKELKIYKDREVELMAKLDEAERDFASYRAGRSEENSKETIELSAESIEMSTELERLKNIEAEMKAVREDYASLLNKQSSVDDINKANLESLKEAADQVQSLQKQLLHESSAAEELSKNVATLEESLAALAKEKEDLIALVTTKHNENVQYHNEIVRLNQLLQQEAQKAESQHDESNQQLNDQVKFLSEKCEALAQSLLQEQNGMRLLMQEKNDAVDVNIVLTKDIERLRQHLLEVADAYTMEQVTLQKQNDEYKSKLMNIEMEAKKSSNAYTSANIRANQHAETLQTQYNLLVQQRDDLLVKLSEAEDNENKNQAALTNLQVALELFQKDKERDVELQTSRFKKELEFEKILQQRFKHEMLTLQAQLEEAKNGLMAAARLGDQLALNQHTIDRLNNEIASYHEAIQSLKRQLEDSNANTSNADVDLIKNLVIGYITAPNNNANAKSQILKLIANVLNLNEQECAKVGLRSGSGATSSWFWKDSTDTANNNVSLTEAFVAFLEKESRPRASTDLLTMHSTASEQATTGNVAPAASNETAPVQVDSTPGPITLGEPDYTLLTPYNNRSSSTILKDLLHDT